VELTELKQIEHDLIEGIISYKEAAPLVFDSRKKPYHTKEWKEQRDKIIKDSCEQCGSNEVLTLQHLWRPQKYADFVRKQMDELISIEHKKGKLNVSDQEVEEYIEKYGEMKESCPKCENVTLTRRKTNPELPFKCNRCRKEFKEPVIKKHVKGVRTKLQLKDKLRSKKLSEINNKIWEQKQDEIRKNALIKTIQEHIKYMSLEGTATFCKKCAFLMDKRGLILCKACKKEYHPLYKECCADCATN